jgi:hypothetical protein
MDSQELYEKARELLSKAQSTTYPITQVKDRLIHASLFSKIFGAEIVKMFEHFVNSSESRVMDIKRSINSVGVIYEVLISKDGYVIDGYSRVLASSGAVPAKVIDINCNESEENMKLCSLIFLEVNKSKLMGDANFEFVKAKIASKLGVPVATIFGLVDKTTKIVDRGQRVIHSINEVKEAIKAIADYSGQVKSQGGWGKLSDDFVNQAIAIAEKLKVIKKNASNRLIAVASLIIAGRLNCMGESFTNYLINLAMGALGGNFNYARNFATEAANELFEGKFYNAVTDACRAKLQSLCPQAINLFESMKDIPSPVTKAALAYNLTCNKSTYEAAYEFGVTPPSLNTKKAKLTKALNPGVQATNQ